MLSDRGLTWLEREQMRKRNFTFRSSLSNQIEKFITVIKQPELSSDHTGPPYEPIYQS